MRKVDENRGEAQARLLSGGKQWIRFSDLGVKWRFTVEKKKERKRHRQHLSKEEKFAEARKRFVVGEKVNIWKHGEFHMSVLLFVDTEKGEAKCEYLDASKTKVWIRLKDFGRKWKLPKYEEKNNKKKGEAKETEKKTEETKVDMLKLSKASSVDEIFRHVSSSTQFTVWGINNIWMFHLS